MLRIQRSSTVNGNRVAAVSLMDVSKPVCSQGEGVIPRRWPEAGIIAHQWRQQTIRMRALHVTFDAFRAKHPAIERKFFPRLESNDLVIADLELNPALLAAEATMRLHQLFCGILRFALPAARRLIFQVRSVTFYKAGFISRRPCPDVPFSNAIVLSPETSVCTVGIRPARL